VQVQKLGNNNIHLKSIGEMASPKCPIPMLVVPTPLTLTQLASVDHWNWEVHDDYLVFFSIIDRNVFEMTKKNSVISVS